MEQTQGYWFSDFPETLSSAQYYKAEKRERQKIARSNLAGTCAISSKKRFSLLDSSVVLLQSLSCKEVKLEANSDSIL